MKFDLSRKRLKQGALAALVSTFLSGTALAQDLGQFGAGDPIYLPLDISQISGEVWIEVDGIDVTEFAYVDGDTLVVEPQVPFEGSFHELVIYIWNGSDYDVLASYSFSSAGGSGGSLSVSAVHELGGQTVNGEVEGIASSAGDISYTSNDGRLEASANYLATTREFDQLTDNPVDLGNYFVQFHQPGAVLDFTGRLGQQSLGYDRALAGDITRRGISLNFARPDQRFEAGLFAMRVSQEPGVKNILGVEDSDDMFYGARVAVRPFATNDLRLSVQAYEGSGLADFANTIGEGDGISVGLDGTLAEGRLRYGLAYGETTWDEDSGGALAPEDGNAILAYVSYDFINDETGSILTLGAEYDKVDYFYYSLANPNLVGGGETYRVTVDYSGDRLWLSARAETQETNVGGRPDWETDRIDQFYLDGTWALRGQGWLSDASLRFGGGHAQQRRLITPPAAIAQQNYTAPSAYIGLEVYQENLSWAVEYSYLNNDDESALNLDTESHTLDAWVEATLSDRFSLSARGNTMMAKDFLGDWTRSEISLGGRYDIDPGRWSVSADAGLTETDEPGLDGGSYAGADLTWSFNPAADLVLSATYRDGYYASSSGADHDAIVGLLLRARTDILR